MSVLGNAPTQLQAVYVVYDSGGKKGSWFVYALWSCEVVSREYGACQCYVAMYDVSMGKPFVGFAGATFSTEQYFTCQVLI